MTDAVKIKKAVKKEIPLLLSVLTKGVMLALSIYPSALTT